MTIENEELDDAALFDQAVSDDPEVIVDPVVEVSVVDQREQPEALETEAAATTETPAEKPAVDDNAPLVPSWRLREINEEKRTLVEKLAAAEARLAQQPAPKVETPQAAEKSARPDPLLDPDGYAAAIRQELREEALNERREESLIRARESNQQEFDEAYAAARQAVDPALKARMQSSRDPGKTLLEWHREVKVKAEVGTDPNAWLEKKMEERLKDPAFLAKAVELARGSAQPQSSNGRPRIELPPSMSGVSRSSAALKSANEDVSDHELFDLTTNG